MDELDIEIEKLENNVALLTALHIQYFKTKGVCGSRIWKVLQEWETKVLSGDDGEESTLTAILIEAGILEAVAKILKKEVERTTHKERKNWTWLHSRLGQL